MAVKQELEISIGPDGAIKIEVKGVKGGKCSDITREIEEELGVVTSREYTSEYYQTEEQGQKIRLGD
jgi:hypothetical protein